MNLKLKKKKKLNNVDSPSNVPMLDSKIFSAKIDELECSRVNANANEKH